MSTEISTGTEMISQPNTDFNFMRIRLETEEFISKIKEGLLGGYVFVQEKDGTIEKRFIKTGEPIVNFIGAGAIEKILSMRVFPLGFHRFYQQFPLIMFHQYQICHSTRWSTKCLMALPGKGRIFHRTISKLDEGHILLIHL